MSIEETTSLALLKTDTDTLFGCGKRFLIVSMTLSILSLHFRRQNMQKEHFSNRNKQPEDKNVLSSKAHHT